VELASGQRFLIRSELLAVLGSLSSAGGTLVTAVLLVAALGQGRHAVRAVALFAIAGFVWLRPGVKPPGAVPVVDAILFAGVVAAMVWLSRAEPVRSWIGRVSDELNVRGLLLLLCVLSVLLSPGILIPIVTNFDTSGWMDSQSYDTFAINIVTGKVPEGSSGYMPLYQYGMALVYYIFGHFFFAQQVVNAVFAVVGLVALCTAAWVLSKGSTPATMIAGVLYVYTRQFFSAIHFTQIEAWYVPLVCLTLLAWASYWRAPSRRTAVWLAVAAGLGLSTRNQGALFFAVIALTPAVVPLAAARRRLEHGVLIAVVVAAILTPWTVRNAFVDGRWSPFANRSAMYVGILTDPRIGLYGVRYWEGWDEVSRDYQVRYPDVSARERGYLEGALKNLAADPSWLASALAWRATAFYGLLPDGFLELDRIRPTNWNDEWARYLFSRTTPLLLLPLSFIAVVCRPTRTNTYLAAAIIANVAIVVASASSEDRVSYPVLPIHVLMVSSLFAGTGREQELKPAVSIPLPPRRHRMVAVAVLIALAAGARVIGGSRNTYRPIMATQAVDRDLRIDASLPLVNDAAAKSSNLDVGLRVRARVMLSNYMFPPKFVGPVGFVPRFATDQGSPQYYLAYLLDDADPPALRAPIGVTFTAAAWSEVLREGDAAELEGVIEHNVTHPMSACWLRVAKVQRLPIPRERMPAFP